MTMRQQLLLRLASWGEARTLPFRIRNRSLEDVLKIADGRTIARLDGMPVRDVVRAVTRATRRPWLMRDRRCLREGVLAFRLLRAAGACPELHFGLDPASLDESVVRAHCWIVLDGEIVLNPPAPALITIFRHPKV